MEDLRFELIGPDSDSRGRFFERQCEGLQNDILSEVIMRTGRQVHGVDRQVLGADKIAHRRSFIACLATEHREVQAFARLSPVGSTSKGDGTLDGVDALGWTGPRTLEIVALVVNRCPFDGQDAELDWRQKMISDLLSRLTAQLTEIGVNKLLLLTQRTFMPAFLRCPYPNKRVRMPYTPFDTVCFGFRVSTIDTSEYAPDLPASAYALTTEANTSLSKW